MRNRAFCPVKSTIVASGTASPAQWLGPKEAERSEKTVDKRKVMVMIMNKDSGTILIVDDEKEIADLLEVYLTNDNYSVYKFYNGTDALRCIEENDIDLAILDVMLPDTDGFRLCQKIRENFYFPVIMLTAKIEDNDRLWD